MDYDKEIEKLEGQLKGIEAAYRECVCAIKWLTGQKEDEKKKKEKDK